MQPFALGYHSLQDFVSNQLLLKPFLVICDWSVDIEQRLHHLRRDSFVRLRTLLGCVWYLFSVRLDADAKQFLISTKQVLELAFIKCVQLLPLQIHVLKEQVKWMVLALRYSGLQVLFKLIKVRLLDLNFVNLLQLVGFVVVLLLQCE